MFRLPERQEVLRDLPKLALTLALAAVGAGLFALLGLPVPWISGSMMAVAVAAFAGVPVLIPPWLRGIVFFVIGLNIGAAVTPETVTGVVTWPASILILLVGLPIVSIACAVPLVRWRGWTRDDALMASVPGALSLILALADSTDADVPRIALVQAVRVAILVAVVPSLIAMTATADAFIVPAESSLPSMFDLALLVSTGLAMVFVIRAIRFPAAALLGPLVASAALHATDTASSVMPQPVLTVAFVMLGAAIGARFAGLGWTRLHTGLVDALMTFAIGFVISLATAVLATWWLGFPFAQTVLAFAPGAFEVMVVMAFLLGADAAYVGAHHTIRFIALAILAPVLFRKRPGGKSGEGGAKAP